MKRDEFHKRYAIKLISSGIVIVLNLVLQLILPRAFSVKEYGYYSYNLNVFTSLVGIANLSSSSALVSKFSKRNTEIGLVKFYLLFYMIMTLILNLGIIIIYPTRLFADSFAGQTLGIVLLGLEVAVLNKLVTDVIGIYDALAIARFSALMQVVLKTAVTIIIAISYFTGRMNLAIFYLTQSFVTIIILVILVAFILKDWKERNVLKKELACVNESNLGKRKYLKEFYIYCKPLVFATMITQGIEIIKNWSLMNWSGAIEQAMFGAAWQLNTLVNYAFTAYIQLMMREFAVIKDDKNALRVRYQQALKQLIWLTTFVSMFIGINAKWVLKIVYGDQYSGAELVTFIIMVYTITQALGQLCGNFLLSLEITKIYGAISVASTLISLVCVFLFQVPNFIWPTGLGASGMALTYLVSNVFSVGISLYINARILGSSFLKDEAIQVFPILICGLSMYGLNKLFELMMPGESLIMLIFKTGIVFIAYSLIIGAIIFIRPDFIGVSRQKLLAVIKRKRTDAAGSNSLNVK